eukprot:EG_transcript_2878
MSTWGALTHVANSAYSYATGTYLPSDAKRLRGVQAAYQQAYGTQDIPVFFQLVNGVPQAPRTHDTWDEQLYAPRPAGCEYGAAVDGLLRAIIAYQRRREQRAPTTTCYGNDPHNLVCEEVKYWARTVLLGFSGKEDESLEVRRRIDFLYNVATDDAVFKPGGAMRALLGDLIRELNKVLQRMQGDAHKAAEALFRQFAVQCAEAVRHGTLFLFNVFRTGPLVDDRGFVGLVAAVLRLQDRGTGPPPPYLQPEDPLLGALGTTSGSLLEVLVNSASFDSVREGCSPTHTTRAPKASSPEPCFYDASGAPCLPSSVAAVRPQYALTGASRLGQRLGDNSGLATHFLRDGAAEALAAWLGLHGATQRLASLVGLSHAARELAGQGGNVLVLLLGGEYVRQFLNVFAQLASEVTSRVGVMVRAADAYIPDALRLPPEHPDFPWLMYYRRARLCHDALMRELQACLNTSNLIMARADEIPLSADLVQQQAAAFLEALQWVAGAAPALATSPAPRHGQSNSSTPVSPVLLGPDAAQDRVPLTKLQLQGSVPFSRRAPPLGVTVALPSAASVADGSRDAAGGSSLLQEVPNGREDADAEGDPDWLDVTVPGAEKDRWAQELERAAKELYMQYHSGVWDCEMTEADKQPFQHEVLKQTALHLSTMSDIVGNRAGEVYRDEMRQYATGLAKAGVQYGLKGAAQAAHLGKLSTRTLSSLGQQLYEYWTVGRHFQQR